MDYNEKINDINSNIENKKKQLYELKEENYRLNYERMGGEEPEYELYESEEYYYNPVEDDIDKNQKEITKKEYESDRLEYEKVKYTYKQVYDEKMKEYKAGSIIPDLDSEKDLFMRKEKASILAKYIIDTSTETPFNIGIFGKWGEGKTTFLKYIKEELNKFNESQKLKSDIHKAYIVDYNASEY